jgi:hypothetical protein
MPALRVKSGTGKRVMVTAGRFERARHRSSAIADTRMVGSPGNQGVETQAVMARTDRLIELDALVR